MQFFRSKIKYFELNAQKYRIEGNFSDNTDRGNIIFVLVFFSTRGKPNNLSHSVKHRKKVLKNFSRPKNKPCIFTMITIFSLHFFSGAHEISF